MCLAATCTSHAPIAQTISLDDARALLATLAAEANQGCGQVYELYQSRLVGKIDGVMNAHSAEDSAVIAAAAAQYDWVPPEAREEPAHDANICTHGLDSMTCPCGCFEGDDGDDFEQHDPEGEDDLAGDEDDLED